MDLAAQSVHAQQNGPVQRAVCHARTPTSARRREEEEEEEEVFGVHRLFDREVLASRLEQTGLGGNQEEVRIT